MRKKSFAATITIIFSTLLVSIIGSTFSTYLFRKNIIKIDDPKVIASSAIKVFDSKDKEASELKLSDMKLGLKPATGEEDVDSEIPSTVTASVGSEGYYVKFKVDTKKAFKIFVQDISIKSAGGPQDLTAERENIKVAIEGGEKAQSLLKEKVLLLSSDVGVEKKEYTMYIWLTPKASDLLKGAKISFNLKFE